MKWVINICFVLTIVFLFQCHKKENIENHTWPEVKSVHKPGTFWWWMGSAVDKDNLTYNLENLADVGMGTVHVVPIYGAKNEEDRYINFLSPKWMEMLAYTVEEANRLGMNLDMSTTTGWPFGGSHVTPFYAAAKFDYEKFTINEGTNFIKKLDTSFLEYVVAYDDNDSIIHLQDRINNEGVLSWTAPIGQWEIYVTYKKGTEQKVKRAAPGNVGLVLDPFSPGGLDYYLDRYDRAFANYDGINIRAQYHDSYEYYRATWTNNFYEQFKEKNNYDLKDYLPAILDSAKINSHIKADYRRTLADLHLAYIKKWNKWANDKGWKTRNQAHGAPGNLLDLYAAADIPETETYGSRKFNIPGMRYKVENNSTSVPPNPLILKFSTSAAHVTGKQLISSETCTWLREHYKSSLSQVKPEIDELFFSGVNHIIFHGNAYTPKDTPWPGWLFYASSHFEKENAFWRDFKSLNSYITRCQSILQSGHPANDILLYWPVEDIYHAYPYMLIKSMNVHRIDWFEDSEFGKLAKHLEEKGYSFDYISDTQLLEVSYLKDRLNTNGNNYKTILIPKTKHIPLPTWRHLYQIAEKGGTVIFQESLPADVPGFNNLEQRRSALQSSISKLKFKPVENTNIKKAAVGNGSFLLGSEVDVALYLTDIREEKIVHEGMNYIRRLHEKGYYYFITNLSDKKLDSWIPLSIDFESAIIYDPRYQDKIGVADVRHTKENNEIYLQLQPGESCFIKTFTNGKVDGNKWKYFKPSSEPLEITGEWQVDFVDGSPILPVSFKTNSLKSWTIIGDSMAQGFAGTAKYSMSFDLPDKATDNWNLDLGIVCESARVKVNGNAVGTLWSFPFNIHIGKFVKPGVNIIEIEVTNISANRLRELDRTNKDWKQFFFIYITNKSPEASNWELMDSGLLGPVTLTPVNYR